MQPPLMQRVPHEFNSAAQPQFAHRICLVDLDRFDTDRELYRNLLVAVPLRDEAQHLGLAVRDHRRRSRPFPLLRRERRGEVMG